jgi:predicted DNA binding CopG/RHH family protein
MRKEYDFSKAKKNSYARKLKKQVNIRLEPEVIDYFKGLTADNGIPYQTLINLFLRDCAQSGKKPTIQWVA